MSLFEDIRKFCVAAAVSEYSENGSAIPLVPLGDDVVQDEDFVTGFCFKQIGENGKPTAGYWSISDQGVVPQTVTLKYYPVSAGVPDVLVSRNDLKNSSLWRPAVNVGMRDSRSPRGTGWYPAAVFKTLIRGISDWYKSIGQTVVDFVVGNYDITVLEGEVEVGGRVFNPNNYPSGSSFFIVAVMKSSIGGTIVVKLVNDTDSEDVTNGSVSLVGTNSLGYCISQVSMVVGNNAGQLKGSDKIYKLLVSEVGPQQSLGRVTFVGILVVI